MRMLFRQFLLNWNLWLRERVALFWTFAFPILMLFAFGLIFRQGSAPTPSVVWVEGSGTAAHASLASALEAQGMKVLRLNPTEAEARWRKGETAAQVEGSGQGLILKVNAYLVTQGMPAAQRVQQAHLQDTAARAGVVINPLPLRMESAGHRVTANYTAFLLPGLLGMNVLSMGLFAVGMVNVFNREKGIFKRLAVTPLPKSVFFLAQILHRLAVFALQSALMLTVGRYALGVQNQGSVAATAVILALGAACFMAMGFALAAFAKTHESFAALSNALFFPMMLFSGVYFTLDSAPKWLQHGALLLPLSPFLQALRAVFNDGAALVSQTGNLVLVGAWALLCFGIAMKKFRWV